MAIVVLSRLHTQRKETNKIVPLECQAHDGYDEDFEELWTLLLKVPPAIAVSQSISQSISQSVSQSVNQSISQSVSQSVIQSVSNNHIH